ncbi:MAG: L-2-amino-thiazoline-4-carboxylic acid hydrolase [Ilumatobacter sp.]|uniref:L-2-amino-thiazoline-4-carboxylic acid hydrolase n=1 Tax=Ilumatobacter sp. TaxID=1967498 RepID=UPI00261AC574|nr:L-2-amino-thiazoline-4-carboxylic acid hydrolase [Ilumatobacter sp.]MDJ0770284.1 L-2-amino-thiazoline-4-carboxylic acid hydrolase [Ilumatobacter sp.]
MDEQAQPDTLNEIGVLKRREIEARIVAPLLERLADEYGAGVYEIAADTIARVARQQGRSMAAAADDDSLPAFAAGLAAFSQDGAMDSEIVELNDDTFAFDVTRCGYADMYRALGLAELGATMSCNRDGSLIEGFNPNVEFTRTKTIMQGDDHCDFVFRLRDTPVSVTERPDADPDS